MTGEGQGHIRLAPKQVRGGLNSSEVQQYSPVPGTRLPTRGHFSGAPTTIRSEHGTTSNLLPSNCLVPPGVTGRALSRTRLADNGTRQGDISGCLFNIGRRGCPRGEGTSADGEPLSSAPVCGKESRGLGGDARDLGRLGSGHGGRGRHGNRCLSLNNSRNVYGLTRGRQSATHQDGRHASGLGYRSTWDSNCPGTQGDRRDHFSTNRPRVSSRLHSPGDLPPDANADGYIHRNG